MHAGSQGSVKRFNMLSQSQNNLENGSFRNTENTQNKKTADWVLLSLVNLITKDVNLNLPICLLFKAANMM